LAELDRKVGMELLFELLKNCELPFFREEIVQKMREVSGQYFGFDPEKSADDNTRALEQWEKWLEQLGN